MRKLLSSLVAGTAIVGGLALPAAAQSTQPSAVDVVISASGAEGTDRNGNDYDLLREALIATGLVDAVNAAEDVTIFAPNDRAFIRLARDLGYHGWDEAGALGFLIEATGFESADNPGLLDDVLLYHVAPGAKTTRDLNRAGEINTLLPDTTVEVRWNRVIDNDTDDRDARITWPRNIQTSNGTIQTVNQVLRPIDL